MKAQVGGDSRRLGQKPKIFKIKEIQPEEPKKLGDCHPRQQRKRLEQKGSTVNRNPGSTLGESRWARGDSSGSNLEEVGALSNWI